MNYSIVKRPISILFFFLLPLISHAGDFSKTVECGTWVKFSAASLPDFHFSRWNDGCRDSVRSVQVNEDVTYTAYFSPMCGDYAALPIVNRYDWVLLVDVRKIVQEMKYTMSPERVHWYRVVGNVDLIEFPDEADPKDAYLGEGYSWTLNKNLYNSGIYYALVDLLEQDGMTCSGLSRTELVSFQAPEASQRQLRLLPNVAIPNSSIRLVGLNPNIQSNIRVYSVTGQLLDEFTSIGLEECILKTYPRTGVYEVQVLSDEDQKVLRYIVRQ